MTRMGRSIDPLLAGAIAAALAAGMTGGAAAGPASPGGAGPVPPSISRIVIGKDGASAFEGRGSPGSQVLLRSDGRTIATAHVGETGTWSVAVVQAATIGDHRFSSAATDAGELVHGDEVRISVPDTLSERTVITYEEPRELGSNFGAPVGDELRRRAEELARAATGRFSDLMDDARRGMVVAEAEANRIAEGSAPTSEGAGVMRSVTGWLEHAADAFQSGIVDKLATPGSEKATGDQSQGLGAQLMDGARTAWSVVQDWLSSAGAYLQGGTAKETTEPPAGTEGKVAARDVVGPASPAADSAGAPQRVADSGDRAAEIAPPPAAAGAAGTDKPSLTPAEIAKQMKEHEERFKEGLRKLDEAAKSGAGTRDPAEVKREAEAAAQRQKEEAVLKELQERRKAEVAKRRAEYEKLITEGLKRLEEAQKAEDARKAAEQKRLDEERANAEEARKDAETRRLAEATRKAAEQKRLDEERAKAEEARKVAETERLKAEAARKAAEAQRLAEAAKRKADESERFEKERLAAEKSEAGKVALGAEPQKPPALRAGVVAKKEEQRPSAERSESGAAESSQPAPRVAVASDEPRSAAPSSKRVGKVKKRKAKRMAASDNERPRTRRNRKSIVYVVRSGDTLWTIANRYLGNGKRYGIIYRANRKLRSPHAIYPRQRLVVPLR